MRAEKQNLIIKQKEKALHLSPLYISFLAYSLASMCFFVFSSWKRQILSRNQASDTETFHAEKERINIVRCNGPFE